jgi:hypothetical protein
MVIDMKTELIDMVEPFDPTEDSIFLYEDKVREIIDKRIVQLKNLNSHEWNMFSDAAFELFKGYEYLIEALDRQGQSSKVIKLAKDALEYAQIYRGYIDNRYMQHFSDAYLKIIKKYKVEL